MDGISSVSEPGLHGHGQQKISYNRHVATALKTKLAINRLSIQQVRLATQP